MSNTYQLTKEQLENPRLRNKMYNKYILYSKELCEISKEITELIVENKKLLAEIENKKRMAKLLKNAKISFTDINKIFYV
jgi:hypothetical protein